MSRAGTTGAPAYEFVEGATSDLAFVARGGSPEAVFTAAADALLAATLEQPEHLGEGERRRLALEEPTLDLLLLRWLNELVYLRDAEQLLLRCGRIAIGRDGGFHLEAELSGDRVGPRHRLLADVKAATAHGLWMGETRDGWEAKVTLDV
jgi:SHS2 domain-containing protein